MNRGGWIVLAVSLIVIACAVTLWPGGHRAPGGSARSPAPGAQASLAALPQPSKGFAIPRPRLLRDRAGVTRWAPVLEAAEARERPTRSSPGVVRVGTQTPEGTTNLVVVIGEAVRHGVTWVHARLAVLPDARTGWLPRSVLGGWQFVMTHLVINRARETLTLLRAGRVVFRTRVGVGKPSTPTPAGQFYIRDRLTRYASPEYGPLAFGTSARSPYETDWPAGGFIGIHGTDQPGLIPGQVSHGCIRLRNPAIRALGRLLPIGTPVTIT
ncbi:MAG TPA: L,D-transpeptidase family protein [Solirubrobacteraceae bacterium]|nr:L,D-transpeptidase family protein [Solirubrobacteraceae bacterium]